MCILRLLKGDPTHQKLISVSCCLELTPFSSSGSMAPSPPCVLKPTFIKHFLLTYILLIFQNFKYNEGGTHQNCILFYIYMIKSDKEK